MSLEAIKTHKDVSKLSIFVVLLVGLFLFGSLAEAIFFAEEIFKRSEIAGYGYITLISAISYFIGSFIFDEVLAIWSLKSVDSIKAMSDRLKKMPTDETILFANQIIKHYQTSSIGSIGVEKFRSQFGIISHGEIINAVSRDILTPIDIEVEKLIFKYAKENGVVSAVSPVAILDLLFLFWRNMRMAREIFELYGFKTGFVGQFVIMRKIGEALFFAGVAEMTEEAISILTSQTLVSKVSSSIASGLGNAIFTVRVGIAVIETVRPIKSENKIGLITKFIKSFNPFKRD